MKILKKSITLFLIIIMTLSMMPMVAIADSNDSKLLNSFNQKVNRTYSTSGGDPMEITFELYKGFSSNNSYYFRIDNSEYLDYVQKVVVGNYSSLTEAKNQRDIKDQIFAIDYNVRGYFANYKDGVSFTFFYGRRGVRVVNVKAVEGEFESDYEPNQDIEPEHPKKEENKSEYSNEPENSEEENKGESNNSEEENKDESENSEEDDENKLRDSEEKNKDKPGNSEDNNNENKTLMISVDGENDRIIDISDGKQIQLPQATKYVPYESIIKIGNDNNANMKIISGNLPEGITFDEQSGMIYGIPKEEGIFNLSISLNSSQTVNFVLNVNENSKNNIDVLTDEGYEIIISVPDVITEYSDYIFEIEGEFDDFRDLWIDGDKKIRDVDYIAEKGSTKITIKSQTFKNIGSGTHTIAAEFHVDGNPKKVKRAVQNYTVNINENSNSPISPTKTNPTNLIDKSNETNSTNKSNETNSNINSVENFSDVDESAWYSADVKWVCQNKLMYGVGNGMFAPNTYTTRAMSIATLARMSGVSLESYGDNTSDKWYTESVNWAKNIGILDEIDFSDQNFDSLYSREKFAIIVYRYLNTLNVTYNVTETLNEFSDVNSISKEGIEAFKMLYQLGILYGESESTMNPDGNITRAQLAAILHRISDLSINKN